MIILVDVVKNGNRILGYNCLENGRKLFLNKEEVAEEIKNKNCANGRLQMYKGAIIIRIVTDDKDKDELVANDIKMKVIDLETLPHVEKFNTVTKTLNPLFVFK